MTGDLGRLGKVPGPSEAGKDSPLLTGHEEGSKEAAGLGPGMIVREDPYCVGP